MTWTYDCVVNAVTVDMEYAMLLEADLLTELEGYQWFALLTLLVGFGRS